MAETKTKPSIRFAGFNDAWEQRELGEISEQIGDIDHRMPSSVSNGIPYLMTGDFVSLNDFDFENAKKISHSDYIVLSEKIKPEVNDIVFARYASIGAVRLVKDNRPFLVSYSCAIIKLVEKEGAKFIYYSLQTEKSISHEKKVLNTGTQANIGIDTLSRFPIHLPSLSEQLLISTFFQDLDRLITLHQRKYEKLLNLKKAMLEKIFPQNGADIPEVRFAGFTDAWEQRKFFEIFVFIQNNSLTRADLNHKSGSVKNVHYGDVLIKFGEVLDVEIEEIPFVSDNEFTASSASLLQNGDVIIADAAEDDTVGKCSEIKGVGNSRIVSGLHTIPCRPTKIFSTGYLGYYMNSFAYHDQLLPLIQGTKISSISKTALQITDIIYPCSKEEQRQIGAFFQNLDKHITLHQRKLEMLKNLKKAFLERMFV